MKKLLQIKTLILTASIISTMMITGMLLLLGVGAGIAMLMAMLCMGYAWFCSPLHRHPRIQKRFRPSFALMLVAVMVFNISVSLAATEKPITPSVSGSTLIVDSKLTITTSAKVWTDGEDLDNGTETLSPEAAKASLAIGADTAVTDGKQVQLNMSASTTRGYIDTAPCTDVTYKAGSTTLTITVTNTSDDIIRVSSITSKDGVAAITSSPTPFFMSKNDSFTITLTANPTADTMTSAVSVSDEVTIVAGVVSNCTVTLSSGQSAGYTLIAGDVTVTVGAGKTVDTPVPIGGTVTMPASAPTAPNGYFFYGWRIGDGQLLQSGQSFTAQSDTSVTPVFLPTTKYGSDPNDGNKIKLKNANGTFAAMPFQVGSERYLFWADAFAAAKNTGTVVLAENYTLPTSLEDNGVGELGCIYLTTNTVVGTNNTTITNLTYHIPANHKFLVPRDASYSSDFDQDPYTMGDDGSSDLKSGTYGPAANGGTQAVFRNLNIGSNTIIQCTGKINVNSMIFIDTAYSGCPGGPYGQITLTDPTAEIVISNGGRVS